MTRSTMMRTCGAGFAAAAIAALSAADGFAQTDGAAALTAARLAGELADAPIASDEILVTRSDDPLRIYISLDAQRLDVYRGMELITSTPISSGRAGHRTPRGVFSILDKRRTHFSNLYDDAPMPFMQRLTWSGIAIHAGTLPGYPASHGCIRVPMRFARQLFQQTALGGDVVVTGARVRPRLVAHDALFQPMAPMLFASADGPAADREFAVSVAAQRAEFSDEPLRILITRATLREEIVAAQEMLDALGYAPGPADGVYGRGTARAARAFQADVGLPQSGVMSSEFMAQLYALTGRAPAGGRLYVRQGHVDVYDAPVVIADPEAPLGMHSFAALGFDEGDHAVGWTAVTLDDEGGVSPEAALGRLAIPAESRAWIEARMTPGTTLIVADEGRGRETGPGTDFIVQPR